jgi:hypothetical protein
MRLYLEDWVVRPNFKYPDEFEMVGRHGLEPWTCLAQHPAKVRSVAKSISALSSIFFPTNSTA